MRPPCGACGMATLLSFAPGGGGARFVCPSKECSFSVEVATGHSFAKMHADPTLWMPFSEKTNGDITWAKESARYLEKSA